MDLGQRLTALLQVVITRVHVGPHLLMIELGTPDFSSRLTVVWRESCRRIGQPGALEHAGELVGV
jgi:hypothetical protein